MMMKKSCLFFLNFYYYSEEGLINTKTSIWQIRIGYNTGVRLTIIFLTKKASELIFRGQKVQIPGEMQTTT